MSYSAVVPVSWEVVEGRERSVDGKQCSLSECAADDPGGARARAGVAGAVYQGRCCRQTGANAGDFERNREAKRPKGRESEEAEIGRKLPAVSALRGVSALLRTGNNRGEALREGGWSLAGVASAGKPHRLGLQTSPPRFALGSGAIGEGATRGGLVFGWSRFGWEASPTRPADQPPLLRFG